MYVHFYQTIINSFTLTYKNQKKKVALFSNLHKSLSYKSNMEQERQEKSLILEALLLHRMHLPNDEQKELREDLIESVSMEIADIQFEIKRQP